MTTMTTWAKGKSTSIGKKQRRVPLASMRSQQSQPSQRTQPLIHGERRVSSIPTPRRLDYQKKEEKAAQQTAQKTAEQESSCAARQAKRGIDQAA